MDESRLLRVIDGFALFDDGTTVKIPAGVEVYERRRDDGTFSYLFGPLPENAPQARSGRVSAEYLSLVLDVARRRQLAVSPYHRGVYEKHFAGVADSRIYFLDGDSYEIPAGLVIEYNAPAGKYTYSRADATGKTHAGYMTVGERVFPSVLRDMGIADQVDADSRYREKDKSIKAEAFADSLLACSTS